MNYNYQFYNRSKEISDLKANFEKSIKNKVQIAYLIRGKKGIGKTCLINKFTDEIVEDIALISDIPSFKKEKDVISIECEQNNLKAYHPFIEITKSIINQKKIFTIGINLVKVFLSIFGINDVLDSIEKLANSVHENKDAEKLKQKEIRLFNQYRKFVKKRSSKTPIIIFIQNAQWIDSYSLKLIQKLVSDDNYFWGMIILEQDELELSEELNNEFNKILATNKFNKIELYALDKSFPSKVLSGEFGEGFFSSDENDMLYAISEGNPGILIDFIENTCIRNNYLNYENGKWKKIGDFKESIKPANQKLLELIISLYEDNELSESELRLIKKMSLLWGISNSHVNQTVNMVKDVMTSGYRINQILDSGIISNNSFSVTDASHNRFIIEHVKINNGNCDINYENRGFENKHLLEALSYKVCENGVLIIWDYYDGKKSRQVIKEEFEKHISSCIRKFVQISEGLAELHQNNLVHGFLNPRSIIETGEGNFQLASFNHGIYKYIVKENEENTLNDIYFLAPEQLINEEPTISSDIFSLGVLFYYNLTNKFPFQGRSNEEIVSSIRNNKIELKGQLESYIPAEIIDILRTSMSFNPEVRFKSAEEFHKRLVTVNYVPTPTPQPNTISLKPIPNYKKYLLPLGLTAIILIGFIFREKISDIIKVGKSKVVCMESKITVESLNNTSDSLKIIDPNIIEYLLQYNISNISNLTLLNDKQFNTIHRPNKKEIYLPQKSIICKIINSDFGYEFDFKITDNKSKSVKKENITFSDPSELLNGKLDKITSSLANRKHKRYLLTKDWDAFLNFYRGELKWNILNVNEAINFFRKSNAIDSSFLLPKLRLAKIYRFSGNNTMALDLLKTVKASINNLTIPDSLRTLALWNILDGKTRDAVNNYKQLISYLPAQKEPYYELAEAYFELRDINNAITNYKTALKIDPDFTLALNHYGYSLSHIGQHDSALVYFKKYVNLEPTANAYDSYGDGFFAAGKLDSAKWAKLKGLELDPKLDYLYSSLAYINIREGKLKDAENNINKYLSYQSSKELISTGLTDKSYVYFLNKEFRKSLDTCLKAKSLFDSEDLVTRNHVLHWVLAKIYFNTNDAQKLQFELAEMKSIIYKYKIDEYNYNMIYKFYNDIIIHELIKHGDIDEANKIISIFDNEIYNKVKDWSSPYDVAYFNNEFGQYFMETNHFELAKERFDKSLAYNHNYAQAHYNLSNCLRKLNLLVDAEKHLAEYKKLTLNADK